MKCIKRYLLSLLTLMLMIPSNSFAANSVKDIIIYESEGLKVLRSLYTDFGEWCGAGNYQPPQATEINVFYDLPHEQRLNRMGKSYKAFFQNKVVPAIHKVCGQNAAVRRLAVTMYRPSGEFDFNISFDELKNITNMQLWDMMVFDVNNGNVRATEYIPKGAAWEMTPEQITAITPKSIVEARQVAYAAFIEKNTVWPVGSCKGEYCEFGQYMNSIYHNDVDMIRKFDRVKLTSSTGSRNYSLLRWVANYYLYNMACLSDDAVRKTATHTTDTYGLEMGGVYIGQGGGDVTRATYLINPKFVPLCDRVCNHGGGNPNRDIGLNGWKNSFPDIFDGIDQIKVASCNTPKKKQFERNLISMTLLFYDNQSTWFKPAKDYPISPTTH